MKMTGKELAVNFEDCVNSTITREFNEDFIKYVCNGTHRTLQSEMVKTMVNTIIAVANQDDWRVDGRNETAVRVCKLIKSALENNLLLNDEGKIGWMMV